MKYYIMLQPSIKAMGGEEMYTRNKVISAREHGYVPIVFHSGIGEQIYIKDLKEFEKYEFPEFRYEPCVVSNAKKTKLIKRISSLLPDYEEDSIIESHEILVAEWGEWIASKLGVRHFAYMLLEHNTLIFEPVYKFFRFKYDRKELAGIFEETIPDMFANYDISDIEGYCLPAYGTNVYEDIPCPEHFKVGKADYTIGSIGRTNKQCVQPIIDAIVKFVTRHSEKFFNVLYIGGSMDKKSEELVIKRLSSISNVKLIFTGMLFPISVTMVKQMDVCIATSGSCRVSENCGIPTIAVDGNDSKAIGILGETAVHILFRGEDEPPIEIDELLEDVLIKKVCTKRNIIKLINVDFNAHWDFILNMNKEKDYFDIDTIQYPLKRRMISLLLGYYYGLSPMSLKYRIIQKIIQIAT